MKTMLFGLTLAFSVCFFMSSCEKANIQSSSAAPAQQKKPHVVASPEKGPLISLSTTVDYFCGGKAPCGTTTFSITKYNQLSVTNNSQSFYPSLTYTYYLSNGASPNETYTPISGAQYTCNLLTSPFAGPALPNGARILVFANDPLSAGQSMSTSLNYNITTGALTPYPPVTAASNFIIATMGNYKGLSCI